VLELHVPLVRQSRRPAGVAPGPVVHLGRVLEVVVSDNGASGSVEYLREGVPVDQVQESAGQQQRSGGLRPPWDVGQPDQRPDTGVDDVEPLTFESGYRVVDVGDHERCWNLQFGGQ
jgi:hypothetical protein